MGWILYFTIKVLELIVKALKLWWKLICKCFTFIVLAVDELKTLKWEKEEDKPKIIKNSVIITVGVLAIIFLIWLLVSIFNGSLGSSRRNISSNTNNNYVQQTVEKKQETVAKQNDNMSLKETTKAQETTKIQETVQIEETKQTEPINQTTQTAAQMQPVTEQQVVESMVIETTQVQKTNDKEVKIVDKKKFTDHYEYSWTSPNDNYDVDHCEISITIPVIGGIDVEETETINAQIEELAFQLIDRIKDEEVLSNKYNAVLDVNLDKHNLQYTDDKITIILNGSNKYASDYFQESPSYCAFVIEYDRNNQESQMRKQAFGDGYLHLQSDEIFYAR
ncbi:MAG: hypothetical protein II411_01670 [Lachnospiraceae bacterium]|nr:hypothetical protein [Lachnospiraceae bacterium]